MVYGDFKDLTRRTAFDKVLRDKAFNTAKNPKCDGYQKDLLLWFTNFLIKSRKGGGVANSKVKQNRRPLELATLKLAEESHKPIIKNFKKRTVYSGSLFGI